MDWDWEATQVLYIDLNACEYLKPDNLNIVVDNMLSKWERQYDITKSEQDITTRFRNIIEIAHNTTGEKVVILVDEYDKPLVKNLDKEAF